MIKIYFIPVGGSSSKDILEASKRYAPNNKAQWKDMIATANIDEADFFIVRGPPAISIPDPSRTFYFGGEPPYFLQFDYRNLPAKGKFYYDVSFGSSSWWVDGSYDSLSAEEPPIKEKNLSAILSGKSMCEGHRLRLNFARYLCENFSDKFDLFGQITRNAPFSKYPNSKGPLAGTNKRPGLAPYKFSIAIENGSFRNYFTEKICDTFLTWTIPIYWGCPNIAEFFPKGSFIQVDIQNLKDIERVFGLINSDYYERNFRALCKARDLILNKYNLWSTMYEAVTTGKLTW